MEPLAPVNIPDAAPAYAGPDIHVETPAEPEPPLLADIKPDGDMALHTDNLDTDLPDYMSDADVSSNLF